MCVLYPYRISTCSKHSNSNFAHSYNFHCNTNFAVLICGCTFDASYNVHFQFIAWRVFNALNLVSKIWVGMSATNIHLLQSKIKNHLQKRRLWIPLSLNSFRRKNRKKFLTLHAPFCIFHFKNLSLNCHPEYFRIYSCLMKPSYTL